MSLSMSIYRQGSYLIRSMHAKLIGLSQLWYSLLAKALPSLIFSNILPVVVWRRLFRRKQPVCSIIICTYYFLLMITNSIRWSIEDKGSKLFARVSKDWFNLHTLS